jgi:hypothetical protein
MQKFCETEEPHKEVGTNGSIRPRKVEGWADHVKTEEDARRFIQ